MMPSLGIEVRPEETRRSYDLEALRKESFDGRMRDWGGRGRVFEDPGISPGLSPGRRFVSRDTALLPGHPIFSNLTQPNPIRIASYSSRWTTPGFVP